MSAMITDHRFKDDGPINGLCDECGSSVTFHAVPGVPSDSGVGESSIVTDVYPKNPTFVDDTTKTLRMFKVGPLAHEDFHLEFEETDHLGNITTGNAGIIDGGRLQRNERMVNTIITAANNHARLVAALRDVLAAYDASMDASGPRTAIGIIRDAVEPTRTLLAQLDGKQE